MPKRMVRKLDLEIALSKIRPHPSPKAKLEQYTLPPEAASELLYTAAYTYDDIIGRTVADLGCGTGILAIGSVLLGAKEATGVDIDRGPLKTAQTHANILGVGTLTQWVAADVTTIRGQFDTVLQNPPFGVQKRRADRRFLQKALEIGNRVYSLHMSSSRRSRGLTKGLKSSSSGIVPVAPSPFLERFIKDCGGEIQATYAMIMTIPWMFEFHRKPKHRFPVELYVINSEKSGRLP